MIKKRFKILKNAYEGHSIEYLEDIFVVCCMLHNIVLIVDGYDNYSEYQRIGQEVAENLNGNHDRDEDSDAEEEDEELMVSIAKILIPMMSHKVLD